MKKFTIFTLSFTVLFLLWQIVSGALLTLLYTPNIGSAWKASANLSNEVMISNSGSPFWFSLT